MATKEQPTIQDLVEPTIQDVVDTGMPFDRIRDVVNGIAKGIRYRLDHERGEKKFNDDVRTSLARIADALDYLVALSKGEKQ
jgi:hypothetical protein